jgi:cytochrome c-type biogenesis protein CcmH
VSRAHRVAFGWLLLALVLTANATKMDAPAPDAALDLRIKNLETELRCLVCQNQTLADSNAELAGDLRREVRDLAKAGKSDEQIKAYLVARYGDFVLYNPPVKSTTWLLWVGPFALLLGGGILWWTVLQRRGRMAGVAASASDPEGDARARERLDPGDAGPPAPG